MANEQYLRLITSEHATKPLYMQYVAAFLNMLNAAENCLLSFKDIFNACRELPSAEDPSDPEPGTKESTVDDQLDKMGALIGISRTLPIVDPDIPTVLDNETFQKIIRAKIYANHWDGTIEGLTYIIEQTFPDLSFELIDNQNMSYTISIMNPSADPQEVALLFNGFILPKPSGVLVDYIISDTALFGWDSDTEFLQGWDEGHWN